MKRPAAVFARKRLRYEKSSGDLFWRIDGRRVKAGSLATITKHHGYKEVYLLGRYWQASNIIWLIVTGHWPKNEIDHKNNNPSDNRWVNLREATHRQNMINWSRDNMYGRGVGYRPDLKNKPFVAFIWAKGKQIPLGYYATKEAAHRAYCRAASKLHGEFARYE